MFYFELRRIVATLGMSLSVASAATAGQYSVVNVGTFGLGAQPFAVNNTGQVAGYAGVNDRGSFYNVPFVTNADGAGLRSLGIPGYAAGINEVGQVAGTAPDSAGVTTAFLTAPNGGRAVSLGTLGRSGTTSTASGVNSSGQVVGTSEVDFRFGPQRAFLSAPNGGALKDLGTLYPGNAGSSFGNAVNDLGQVTGSSFVPGSAARAFLSGVNGGALKDLGTLGGTGSTGNAVNNLGQVAGRSSLGTNNNVHHAFLSAPNGGPLTDLGALPGHTYSSANGVNDDGQVVGYSQSNQGVTLAFLYKDGAMYNLNDLIDSRLGILLIEASAISHSGYITAVGYTNPANQAYPSAFLLIPSSAPDPALVPEPSTFASMALGALALIFIRRRVNAKS